MNGSCTQVLPPISVILDKKLKMGKPVDLGLFPLPWICSVLNVSICSLENRTTSHSIASRLSISSHQNDLVSFGWESLAFFLWIFLVNSCGYLSELLYGSSGGSTMHFLWLGCKLDIKIIINSDLWDICIFFLMFMQLGHRMWQDQQEFFKNF